MAPIGHSQGGINNSGTARAVRLEVWQTLRGGVRFNPDACASRLTRDGEPRKHTPSMGYIFALKDRVSAARPSTAITGSSRGFARGKSRR
jgi:hypothetical protein